MKTIVKNILNKQNFIDYVDSAVWAKEPCAEIPFSATKSSSDTCKFRII